VLRGGEPEHARGQREEGEYDAQEAAPVGEEAERQDKEVPYLPAEDVVVALPGPREKVLHQLHG
jgi:hypothetical protein